MPGACRDLFIVFMRWVEQKNKARISDTISNNSLHVSKECTRAIDREKVIIPFRIEDTLPSDAMKYLIGTPHWLDALTPPLEQHLMRLCDNIRVYLDRKKT